MKRARSKNPPRKPSAEPLERAEVPVVWFRDWWLWLSVGAPLLLLIRSLGARLGEPAADDFDFLHHVILKHGFALFDGGGSESFWRPLSHQMYYAAFGGLMLTTPWLITAFHLL